ncbi:MAG: PD40 domain-containing protein [Deltaproteobacteria bacterium]|nr:PD40 domain-containing protein [Deltaproteobacteria bacterium]
MRARLLAFVVAMAIAFSIAMPKTARAVSDPALAWYTIETPHFAITYHSGLEQVAQHVANTCEGIYGTMAQSVGWNPNDRTYVVLTDYVESANGSATALPYNAMRLIVTSPEDLSPLSDVDDWYLELITHEYTHVLHTDQIRGIPAIVNAVVGKTLAPNQVQPKFILEGLAVHHESARTSGGRLRSSQWDMYMRTDVLGDNVASIDQVSSSVRRWPQGNLFYLYGSYLMRWIADTYGEEALRRMAADYGQQLIPWGFNRSARRATGATLNEMYPAWIESMKRQYGEVAAKVRAKGIREGVQITHHGQLARYPRWIPKGAWPEHVGGLLYYREDQHVRAGQWALPVTRDANGRITNIADNERRAEHIARTANESLASFLPDGGVVFSAQEYQKNVYLFGDLEKLEPGAKSSFGTPDGGRTLLTRGLRAQDPAVSPDGRRIVFNQNRAGTRSLHIADLGESGISNMRPLVPSGFMDQAFTPRWSPDGKHVAYSVWKVGGYRDIRVVDVDAGTYADLAVDRAVDGAPSYSADGKYLFFHSDRTGIMNIYAWEVATRRLFQVTNVLTGAYMPEPSPDGKTLAYVGYTTKGFDLFAMELDEKKFVEAEPFVDDHPTPPKVPQRRWEVKPYSPWATVWPRRWSLEISQGSFGQTFNTSILQTDITGFHTIGANMTVELEKPIVQGGLGYTYARLPFDASVYVSRSVTPRAGYQLGPNYKPLVLQETLGMTTSLSYAQPTPYDSRAFTVSHNVSRVGFEIPTPIDKLDPYETPVIPNRGFASTLHLGFSYTNAERFLWSVGSERGYTLALAFDLTHPALGSDFSGFATNGDFTTYFLMPWLRHHSLAVHLGGGTSGGNLPGRGAFYVGSFVDLPLVDTLRNLLIQGGVTLRGYQPVAVAGRSYMLANAEYRFPIVNLDRGPSTLPFFLNRISGNVFFDYGSAFDVIDTAKFKSGTGAELWFDFTLGYVAAFTFRLGYARGLASGGIDKGYFVATFPY